MNNNSNDDYHRRLSQHDLLHSPNGWDKSYPLKPVDAVVGLPPTGINFNINLRVAFLNESVFKAFLFLKFVYIIFCQKQIVEKATNKMLGKLTTALPPNGDPRTPLYKRNSSASSSAGNENNQTVSIQLLHLVSVNW